MLIANDRQNMSSSFVELALLLLRRESSSIQRFKYANLPGLSLSFDGEIIDCFYFFLLSNPLFPHPSGGKEKSLFPFSYVEQPFLHLCYPRFTSPMFFDWKAIISKSLSYRSTHRAFKEIHGDIFHHTAQIKLIAPTTFC